MITSAQKEQVERHAYLPEQLPDYVTAVSEAEPFVFGKFVAYAKGGLLIFVGYPLEGAFEAEAMAGALEEAVGRLSPDTVSLMAPSIPASLAGAPPSAADRYYRLNLSAVSVSQKRRNLLNRAGRELSVATGRRFDESHAGLIAAFLRNRSVDAGTRFIFERIGRYVAASETAQIFEARTRDGRLAAFDVAEFRPGDWAIYMFNFRSEDHSVPGASDLLLSEVMRQAAGSGKRYLNLGLGINPGIVFFKEKWGGVPFLPYVSCLYRPSRKGFWDMLLRGLSRHA